MTYSSQPYNARRSGTRRPSIWTVAFSAVERLFEEIERRRVIRRDLDRLMAFDERELADIGLSRGELMHAVHYGRFPKHSNQRR